MRLVAIMIFLIMLTTSLAGCTGDNNELNSANDRIDELEAQAATDNMLYQKLMNDFTNQSILINQLQNNCCTFDDMYAEWQEGYAMGLADSNQVSTLDTIIERGYMNCGVKTSQYGMGYQDPSTGAYSGLDIEYCRAIAAAIGLNSDEDINYVLATGSDRFDILANGDIDVLIRTTTWTASRDADLNADFSGINFYDGQGILVRSDFITAVDAGNSAYGLDGANICVGIGTTTEGNLQDWSSTSGISFNIEGIWDASDGVDKFIDGTCDALTGDMSAMVAKKHQFDADGSMNGIDIWIAQEALSKEPLSAATRDYDSEWNEIVSWVWYAMVTAEEMGISSTNYGSADTSDPSVDRLLYSNLGLGTDANPLNYTWMQDVLGVVGNYGEAYDRAFCDGTYDGHSGSDAMTGCLISRSGTYNSLVSEGGLQYSPPMR